MARVNGIISDFCDSFIQPPVYSAAMLMPLTDKLEDPFTSRNAYRALRIFLEESDTSERDNEYTLGMLSDRKVIGDFWQESVCAIIESHPEIASAFGSDMAETEIPREMWDHKAHIVDKHKMKTLLDQVNLESILIQSAELLEWLTSDRAGNNGETYAYMHAAKSIFAPICKIVKFGGLEMALQNRCSQLQLEFTGKQQFVEKAATHLEWIESPEQVERVMQSMFEGILGYTVHEQALSHNSEHGIIIGEGITEDDDRVIWRVKALARVAEKLVRKGIDAKLMDIAGATLIVKDEPTLAAALASILERVNVDDRMKLTPSPSRDHAIHVRGDSAYIDVVREALGYTTIEEMEDHVDVKYGEVGGFRVAKVTFTYDVPGILKPVPFEVQINTEQDRVSARVGRAAHIYTKYPGAREAFDPKDLEELRSRHASIGNNDLVGPSRERARTLRQMIMGTSF